LTITTGEVTDVLTVSSAAITTLSGASTVSVQTGISDGETTAETRTVEVGLVGDATTEIVSGLEAGEVVMLPESGGLPSGFTLPDTGGLGGGLPGGG
jgi:hypothetical protein